MARYCLNCGPVGDDEIFCPHCGRMTVDSPLNVKVSDMVFAEKGNSPICNRRRRWLIVGVIAALIIVPVFLWAAHTHDYEERTILAATCEEDGIYERYCSKCWYKEERVEDKKFHDWKLETVLEEADCTTGTDGRGIYKCENCGKTEEKTILGQHQFSGGECTNCGVVKSSKEPNTWYTLNNNNTFRCQNAVIRDAVPVSQGKGLLISYYPACMECQICGTLQMTGVTASAPVTESYYCRDCGIFTYCHFVIEY